ncbi:histone H4 transcription factor [Polistes fuscatus]|uniref:histone H4 transcription factor n=1 Tax=Polistes fuscatus TaxID=30207 RepID=UPI001CA7C380|nr:histone H4 transcription factor [Polistes fuscatus]
MTEFVTTSITSNELQERCNIWVESQNEHLYSEDTSKDKIENNYNDYETDSEFDSVSECGGKKRRVGKYLKHEILHLVCEWKNCKFDSKYMEVFSRHVANHLSDLEIKIKEDDTEVYVCQWKNCSYESGISDDISRHVNYHSYHTKLKCIGSNIRQRVKLPKCNRDTDWKNIIDSQSPHMCRWEECLKIFSNYQMYLYHIITHMDTNLRGNKVEGGIECKWTGCKNKYPSLHKLRDHLRCHTKEKIVACPDCGTMFASNTKFHTHCKRQIPIDVQGFQCSHCNKFYPTEGILRDHMRLHVFNYKCTLCDMTCESPASLAKHVRYRHVSTRTFPCQLCSHAAKSQQDLDSHMTVHTNGPNFSCHFEGCSFTCKGAYTLDRHVERVHSLEVRWYCCHECPVKYRKSYRLSKHLIEAHHLQLPSGHKRFQYVQDEDGCYRLQMVRYETVDEENISSIEKPIITNKNYKLKLDKSSSLVKVEILEDNNTEDVQDLQIKPITDFNIDKSMPVISNILITFDEIDEKGNITKSRIINSQSM